MNSPGSFYKSGKIMYLVGLAELAIYGFFKGDFAMTRPPQSPSFLVQLNPSLAYAVDFGDYRCLYELK